MEQIVLRASSVRTFHEAPKRWFDEHILGIDKFEGNLSTFLGNVVHRFAETYYTLEEFSPYEILDTNILSDEDKAQILLEYKDMCDVLKEQYLSKHDKPELIEHYMNTKSGDITFQGTCDAYDNGVLIDYKTSGKMKKDISEYYQQLNIYAYLLSLTGREVHTLRVVNIVRRTKTMTPRVAILECDADINEGKRLVKLMVEKTKLALDNPQYKDLIFTDNKYSFLSGGFNIETRVLEFKE